MQAKQSKRRCLAPATAAGKRRCPPLTSDKHTVQANTLAARPQREPSKASAAALPPCRHCRQAPLPLPHLRPVPRACSASRRISSPAPTQAEQSKCRCPPLLPTSLSPQTLPALPASATLSPSPPPWVLKDPDCNPSPGDLKFTSEPPAFATGQRGIPAPPSEN
jgi:hypothetical protein